MYITVSFLTQRFEMGSVSFIKMCVLFLFLSSGPLLYCCCGLKLCIQDEDEEQGTLKFGKQKEQASYGGMDEEEKAIWKVKAPPLALALL